MAHLEAWLDEALLATQREEALLLRQGFEPAVGPLRCFTHGRGAVMRFRPGPTGTLTFDFETCCDEFRARVDDALADDAEEEPTAAAQDVDEGSVERAAGRGRLLMGDGTERSVAYSVTIHAANTGESPEAQSLGFVVIDATTADHAFTDLRLVLELEDGRRIRILTLEGSGASFAGERSVHFAGDRIELP